MNAAQQAPDVDSDVVRLSRIIQEKEAEIEKMEKKLAAKKSSVSNKSSSAKKGTPTKKSSTAKKEDPAKKSAGPKKK